MDGRAEWIVPFPNYSKSPNVMITTIERHFSLASLWLAVLDSEVGVETAALALVLVVSSVAEVLTVVILGVVVGVAADEVVGMREEVEDGSAVMPDGSPDSSLPVPQGISAPSGWTDSDGGVVSPLAAAIVKRVVH